MEKIKKYFTDGNKLKKLYKHKEDFDDLKVFKKYAYHYFRSKINNSSSVCFYARRSLHADSSLLDRFFIACHFEKKYRDDFNYSFIHNEKYKEHIHYLTKDLDLKIKPDIDFIYNHKIIISWSHWK